MSLDYKRKHVLLHCILFTEHKSKNGVFKSTAFKTKKGHKFNQIFAK
jgi:hypothetical protein